MFHLLAQIPDPSKVVEKATGVSWEAGMLAVIIVAFMSTIIYMVKRQNDSAREERLEASALREEDRKQAQIREEASAARETRMAERIDTLEDTIKAIQVDHRTEILGLLRDVTTAIAASSESQNAMRQCLGELRETLGQVNGDIKEMCSLLKLSPCLIAGRARGDIRIIDSAGNEIPVGQLEEEHTTRQDYCE